VKQLNVLLVEDSMPIAVRLAEVLESDPLLDLIAVVDMESKALEVLRTHHIDVILLDLHLRQGSGFGLLQALETLQLHPCVIVMTNYHLAEYREKSISLGAKYVLDKAHDLERIPELVSALIAAG
jgi:two-component system OmpR family response regulator